MEASPSARKSSRSRRSSRSRTPERRHSSAADVLRRKVLTSSAGQTERQRTRLSITPRSMITEYLTTQHTAQPVLRQKRRAASMGQSRDVRARVENDETPRTMMTRFLSQVHTQTPVVREVRKRGDESEGPQIDDIIRTFPKRKSESLLDEDQNEENIVPDQRLENTKSKRLSRPNKSSFVSEYLNDLDKPNADDSPQQSRPDRRRELSRFGAQLQEIFHDSNSSDSRPSDTPERTKSASIRSDSNDVGGNVHAMVNNNEVIPSSDLEESVSVFEQIPRLSSEIPSPVIPHLSSGKVKRRERSPFITPKARTPVVSPASGSKRTSPSPYSVNLTGRVSEPGLSSSKLSVRNIPMTNRHQSQSVPPKVKNSLPRHRNMSATELRSERGKSGSSITPEARTIMSANRRVTPLKTMPSASTPRSVHSPADPVEILEKDGTKNAEATDKPILFAKSSNLYDFFSSVDKRRVKKPVLEKKIPLKKRTAVRIPTKRSSARSRPMRKELGVSSSTLRDMFKLYSRFPVATSAFAEMENICEEFYANMASDLEAYAAHSGRVHVNCDDILLLLKRQKFITEKESLNFLVEKCLPLEYREALIPMAISGNKLVGTALMKKNVKRRNENLSEDTDDD